MNVLRQHAEEQFAHELEEISKQDDFVNDCTISPISPFSKFPLLHEKN